MARILLIYGAAQTYVTPSLTGIRQMLGNAPKVNHGIPAVTSDIRPIPASF
jgi:hypothetical protein